MITLTKKHTGQTLPMMMDEVAEAFRLLRRTRLWEQSIKGGVYVYEVTRGADGKAWHAHVHVLVCGRFIDQKSLSREWLRCTGDSPICHVKYVHNRESGATYVARYVGKPTGMESWNAEEIVEFAVAVHRRRLVHSFGFVHGAKLEEEARNADEKPAGYVCSVHELRRASEAGDGEAEWALGKLRVAYLNPPRERGSVNDDDLREIVMISKRIFACGPERATREELMRRRERKGEATKAPPPPRLFGEEFDAVSPR